VDLQILGADSSDKVNTSFYLPSNLTDSQINNLTLTYIDTSGHTKKVKTSGNKNPTKIKQKNVDGTKSAGKVTVVFDATSSPVASALPGTVFASLNSVPSNLYQLQSNVNDLNLPALDAKAANLLLQSTMEALARGKNVLAVNQMKLFVAYINLLVKIKHLTAGQAAEITDYAQSIIANIPSFTPGAQAWQDAKAQINALITATNALRAMPSGQKKSLVERLNSAISALSGGKQANGVANLTAFKAAVASGVAKGWLTASEAANLQAGAQAAIDLINSTPAYPPPPPPPAPPVPPPSPEPGS